MPSHPEKPIRVAVVEDNGTFRRGLRAILDLTPGIDCVGMYGTAEEALRHVPRTLPDVVLMDLNLPGITGIECTRELRRLRPEVLVVMLTIEDDNDRVFAALRAGAMGYLLKSSTPAEIADAILLVATGGSPMTAVVARRIVESLQLEPEPRADRNILSPREIQVLNLIAQGRRTKEVATTLGITTATVQTHLRRIYEKLQVNSQAGAVAKFLR